MDLYFKQYKSNFEIYVAPMSHHETYEYAKAFLDHVRPYKLGLYTHEDLEDFKIIASLHGHNIIVEELK